MTTAIAAEAIELRVDKIAQPFHSLDPFPFRERDLDREAEEYIVSWARELPADQPLWVKSRHHPQPRASSLMTQIGLSENSFKALEAGGAPEKIYVRG